MLRKERIEIIGILFVFVGIIALANSFVGITGYAVFSGVNYKGGILISLLFFVIGAVLLGMNGQSGEVLEARVRVNKKDKNSDRAYVFDDIKMDFGGGPITYDEFRRTIGNYRKESGGEELVEVVRQEYGSTFRKAAQSADQDEARAGKAFLEVLGEKVEERKEEKYELDSKEAKRIRDSFRSFDGRINPQQREVLSDNGLVYIQNHGKGEHPKIFYNASFLTIPYTHNIDPRAGLNLAHQIIHLIEKGRNKKNG